MEPRGPLLRYDLIYSAPPASFDAMLVDQNPLPDLHEYTFCLSTLPSDIFVVSTESIIYALLQNLITPDERLNFTFLPPPTFDLIMKYIVKYYSTFENSHNFVDKILLSLVVLHKNVSEFQMSPEVVKSMFYMVSISHLEKKEDENIVKVLDLFSLFIENDPTIYNAQVVFKVIKWLSTIYINHLPRQVRKAFIPFVFYKLQKIMELKGKDIRKPCVEMLRLLQLLWVPYNTITIEQKNLLKDLLTNPYFKGVYDNFIIRFGGLIYNDSGGSPTQRPLNRQLLYQETVSTFCNMLRSISPYTSVSVDEWSTLGIRIRENDLKKGFYENLRSIDDLSFCQNEKWWNDDVFKKLIQFLMNSKEENHFNNAFLVLRRSPRLSLSLHRSPEVIRPLCEHLISKSDCFHRNLTIMWMLHSLDKEAFENNGMRYLKKYFPSIDYYQTLSFNQLFNKEVARILLDKKYGEFPVIGFGNFFYSIIYLLTKTSLSLTDDNYLLLQEFFIHTRDFIKRNVKNLDFYEQNDDILNKKFLIASLSLIFENPTTMEFVDSELIPVLLNFVCRSTLDFEVRTDILYVFVAYTERFGTHNEFNYMKHLVSVICETPPYFLCANELPEFIYSINYLATRYGYTITLEKMINLAHVILNFENVSDFFTMEETSKLVTGMQGIFSLKKISHLTQNEISLFKDINIFLGRLQVKQHQFLSNRQNGKRLLGM